MIWNEWSQLELKLLLVEDDPLEADLIFELLSGTSVSTRREISLGAALERLAQDQYDLILLDTTLPDAEELDALGKIRKAAPQTPVLLLGVTETGSLQLLRAGAQDFLLRQDLTRSFLLRTLTFAVERQALQSEADTLRAKAESLAQRKEQFASMVSHEILNPMTGLLGFAALLARTDLDTKQRGYLQVISDCTKSLSTLVTDLLELSRLEAGRESVRMEPFCLLELLEELGVFLSQSLEGSDVRLLVVSDPMVSPLVRGDRVKLRQILYNLCQNALKFTKKGHVGLRMRLLETKEDAVRVRLIVEDTGRGIPKEKSQQIFEAFSQVESADRATGHGLGLAISARLARVLDSRLQMESRLGSGTIFWLDLKAGRCQDSQTVGPLLSGKTVLAVSDYDPERHALGEIFRGLGAKVFHGPPGEISPNQFDILVTNEGDPRHKELLATSKGRIDRRILIARQPEKVDEDGVLILSAPLRLSRLNQILSKPYFAISEPPSKKARRALIIEDDAVCAAYLSSLFEQLGYTVDQAADEAAAFALVSKRRYEVLTLDGHVGSSDGPTIYRRMRREGWLSEETTVIVISGDTEMWGLDMRKGESHLHLLSKPVQPESIQEILQTNKTKKPQPENAPRSGLDVGRLKALDALGPGAREALFEIFEESIPALIAELQDSVERRCSSSISRLAHQIRGSANSVGATYMAYAAKSLEFSQNAPDTWVPLLFSLKEEFRRTVSEMKCKETPRVGL